MNHPQVKLWYPFYEEEVEVDEKLAPFLKLLWENGVDTAMSCQDTPHPGREDNSSCGRVWIEFPEPEEAVKFLKLCVPHPPTADFAPESLYNRVYIHWWPDHWPRSCRADLDNSPVDFDLWVWDIHLSNVSHCTWDENGDEAEEDKFLGDPWPSFAVSVRFPFTDIELLTKNIQLASNDSAQSVFQEEAEHPTKKLMLGNQPVEIDLRMVKLIQGCWDRDIKTLHCCQGELENSEDYTIPIGPKHKRAYVSFDVIQNSDEILAKIFQTYLKSAALVLGNGYSLIYDCQKMAIYIPSAVLEDFTTLLFKMLGKPKKK